MKRPHEVGDIVRLDPWDPNKQYLTFYHGAEYVVKEVKYEDRRCQKVRLISRGNFTPCSPYFVNAENFALVTPNPKSEIMLSAIKANAKYIVADNTGNILGSIDNGELEQDLDDLVQKLLRLSPDRKLVIYSVEKRASLPPIKVEYTYPEDVNKLVGKTTIGVAAATEVLDRSPNLSTDLPLYFRSE